VTTTQLTQLQSTGGTVGWSPTRIHIEMDGHEVTHFGLDRNLNRYYKTWNGNIYQKQSAGWVMIK
jgi:hypothetical protein